MHAWRKILKVPGGAKCKLFGSVLKMGTAASCPRVPEFESWLFQFQLPSSAHLGFGFLPLMLETWVDLDLVHLWLLLISGEGTNGWKFSVSLHFLFFSPLF